MAKKWGIYSRTASGNYQLVKGWFKTKRNAVKKLDTMVYKDTYWIIGSSGKTGLLDGTIAERLMERKRRGK